MLPRWKGDFSEPSEGDLKSRTGRYRVVPAGEGYQHIPPLLLC